MRRILLTIELVVIFVLFTSFPFTKVSAYSVLIDENGRFVVVGPNGQVLGEQFSGPMSGSGGGMPSGGGGGQSSGDNHPQQQNSQPPSQPSQQSQQPQQPTQQQQQMMQQGAPQQNQQKPPTQQQMQQMQQQMQQQAQQFQGRPSMTGQSFEGQGKPAGSAAEMQKKAQEMMRETGKGQGGQDMMRIGVQNGALRVQSPQGSTGGGGFGGFGQTGQNVDSVKIRESAQKREVEIKANGNELEFEENNVRAKTHFPISVNDKNELTVTTPNGTKTVTVLPEEAVKEAFRRGGMTSFGRAGQTGGGQPGENQGKQVGTTGSQQVELTQENGKLEYKVEGVKEAKLFGFFPVSSTVETHVSAETGAVTSVSQPWFFSNFGFLFR